MTVPVLRSADMRVESRNSTSLTIPLVGDQEWHQPPRAGDLGVIGMKHGPSLLTAPPGWSRRELQPNTSIFYKWLDNDETWPTFHFASDYGVIDWWFMVITGDTIAGFPPFLPESEVE